MATRIIVPEPCNEDWNQMTPAEKGRHCARCAKTVADFTAWPLEDIAAYLHRHGSTQVCGRFRNSQLNVDIPYSQDAWVAQVAGSGCSFLQKLALIFLLAFGFLTSGCGPMAGSGARTPDTAAVQPPQGMPAATDSSAACSKADTTAPMVLGEIAPLSTDTAKPSVRQGGSISGRVSLGQRLADEPAPAELEGPHETAGAPMMMTDETTAPEQKEK